jgi:hypothetical protein
MIKEQALIHQLAEKAHRAWPQLLSLGLKTSWQQTLKDDRSGLLSLLPLKIAADSKIISSKTRVVTRKLGAAALYLWTAANLQDDLADKTNTPRQNLFLANACLQSAWHLSRELGVNLKDSDYAQWQQLLLASDAANLQEIQAPRKPPTGELAPAGKSLFLLAGPWLLSGFLNWKKADRQKLLLAGKYFLAAKQLADDVYDYQDDWRAGRKNFAHRGLKKLPNSQQLPAYYRQQAKLILKLCEKCRLSTKTISAFKKGDCFNLFLEPLETNCQRALTNLNQVAVLNHKHPKN